MVRSERTTRAILVIRVGTLGRVAATRAIELRTEVPGPRSLEIGARLERAVYCSSTPRPSSPIPAGSSARPPGSERRASCSGRRPNGRRPSPTRQVAWSLWDSIGLPWHVNWSGLRLGHVPPSGPGPGHEPLHCRRPGPVAGSCRTSSSGCAEHALAPVGATCSAYGTLIETASSEGSPSGDSASSPSSGST